jgi:hypothetical protein
VWAIWYAQQGIPVFRLDGKRPLETGGFHTASTDAFQVHVWWQERPQANIGIHMVPWWILDSDPRHGGDVQLAELVATYGPLPPTALVHTGGADYGLHYCWQYPTDGRVVRQCKLGLGLETRTTSGYGVAPPSVHPDSGRPYLWDVGQDLEDPGIAEAPEWLLALVCGSGTGVQGGGQEGPLKPNLERGADIVEGERNDTLALMGIDMRRRKFDYSAIRVALLDTNTERCKPPLSTADVEKIAWSCCRYNANATFDSKSARERAAQATNTGSPAEDQVKWGSGASMVMIPLSHIAPEPVHWLWHPYIPYGKITMLEGDPGQGKTFLMLAIAAAVTRGESLPNQSGLLPPGTTTPESVLYITGEDGLADTIRPRAEQTGANLDLLWVTPGITTLTGDAKNALTPADIEHILPFSFENLDILAAAVKAYHIRLVIIDPLTAFLGADVDMHRANEVRPLFKYLGTIAEVNQCAIVVLRHLNKGVGKAIYRGMGSIDFTGSARSVLVVGNSAEDEHKHIMAHSKSSLGSHGTSVVFALSPEGGFAWSGTSGLNADEMLTQIPTSKAAKRSAAADWLLQFLQEGERAIALLRTEAEAAGISWRTLERAKTELRVLSFKKGMSWYWRLPGEQETGPIYDDED